MERDCWKKKERAIFRSWQTQRPEEVRYRQPEWLESGAPFSRIGSHPLHFQVLQRQVPFACVRTVCSSEQTYLQQLARYSRFPVSISLVILLLAVNSYNSTCFLSNQDIKNIIFYLACLLEPLWCARNNCHKASEVEDCLIFSYAP